MSNTDENNTKKKDKLADKLTKIVESFNGKPFTAYEVRDEFRGDRMCGKVNAIIHKLKNMDNVVIVDTVRINHTLAGTHMTPLFIQKGYEDKYDKDDC